MENQNKSERPPIQEGAVVEATDGLVGTVARVVMRQDSSEPQYLVVLNSQQDKQFTIPANLIQEQVGSQIVHLSISRDDLFKHDVKMQVDTDTGNISYPQPPQPQ